MSSAFPTCIIYSSDPDLAQRIRGVLHGRAEVILSTQVAELAGHAGTFAETVIFLDALNGDLFDAMTVVEESFEECPAIVIGVDVSEPILALDSRFVFTVISPSASNRAFLRVYSVAQQQLEQLNSYRVKVTALEDQSRWQAMSTPRPGEVIRGLLQAFTGFRDSTDLLERFLEWIQQHYDVAEAGIYLRHARSDEFRLSVRLNDPAPALEQSYGANHPFVLHLGNGRLVVHQSTLDRLSSPIRAACEKMLRDARAEAIFPMKVASGLIGWIFVGPGFLKESKTDDLKELNMITSCLAAFVERAENQTARLQDAEASQGLLEQLKVAALMLDVGERKVTWMNPEGRSAFEIYERLPVPLERFDPAFCSLVEAILDGQGPDVPLWSPATNSRDYAVAMIGPSQACQGKAFVLLQDVTSDVLLGPEAPQPQLPEGGPRANLCTKIRDPLVAIKTFIQLLPERHLDREFCESFVPIITGSIERIEHLMTTLERRVMESEAAAEAEADADAEKDGEEPEYELRHLLEDVFAEIGEPLEPDRVKNTRDLYLKWSTVQRRCLTQHLAHVASVDGWGRTAAARDLMLEWKNLADLGKICLIVRKGDAEAALARPMAQAAVEGLQNFLERIHGSLEINQQNHSYTLRIILPKICP